MTLSIFTYSFDFDSPISLVAFSLVIYHVSHYQIFHFFQISNMYSHRMINDSHVLLSFHTIPSSGQKLPLSRPLISLSSLRSSRRASTSAFVSYCGSILSPQNHKSCQYVGRARRRFRRWLLHPWLLSASFHMRSQLQVPQGTAAETSGRFHERFRCQQLFLFSFSMAASRFACLGSADIFDNGIWFTRYHSVLWWNRLADFSYITWYNSLPFLWFTSPISLVTFIWCLLLEFDTPIVSTKYI